MFLKGDDGRTGSVARRVLRLVALAIGLFVLVIGIGVYQRGPASLFSGKNAPAEPGADAAQAALDAASVTVEQGIVKFYFASGKADLPPGASEVLFDLVKGAQSGRKLVISGFHDLVGDPARNAALARQRALAVRDALKVLGVADQQIEIRKPEPMTSGGSNADARRVEISLQ
ncbi:MAG: OmpA family protein [Polaromonas sp.]